MLKELRLLLIEKGCKAEKFVLLVLPAGVDTGSIKFIAKGAYSLLAMLRSSEEGGHGH